MQSIAPTKSTLEPCKVDSGNGILGAFPPDTRLTWQLTLEYELGPMEKSSKFKLHLPFGMSDLLYDSPLEAQMTAVYDSKKRPIG